MVCEKVDTSVEVNIGGFDVPNGTMECLMAKMLSSPAKLLGSPFTAQHRLINVKRFAIDET
jgi:hypothetical protein